jgi:hypothetical protein
MWWWYSGYAENVGGIFNEVVFLPPGYITQLGEKR